MIVLDEDLNNPALRSRLEAWWPGPVVAVTEPPIGAPKGTDDIDLPRFLRGERDCVFVTLNERDFYGRVDGDPRFCILELRLGVNNDEVDLVYAVVRRVLTLAPFAGAAKRNGLVIRASRHEARYYSRCSDASRARSIVVF